MHVITQKRIWDAKAQWPHAADAPDTWYRLIKSFTPVDFASMKRTFPATDNLGGRRPINVRQAKALSGRFNLPAALFLSI